jgi:succinate dehydrogenase/fumarate reductase-like Fe-S protein
VRLEPLRNIPVIGDLLVDSGAFMANLDHIDMPLVRRAGSLPTSLRILALKSCIESAACVASACPIAGSDPQYAGPAALAAAWRSIGRPRRDNPDCSNWSMASTAPGVAMQPSNAPSLPF